MIKKIHACNKMNFSSNINEVIKAVLNPLLFFYEKILHGPKAPKAQKAQKAQKRNQAQKYKTLQANKNKNALKKHLRRKK